jgi:hypothetical protein
MTIAPSFQSTYKGQPIVSKPKKVKKQKKDAAILRSRSRKSKR